MQQILELVPSNNIFHTKSKQISELYQKRGIKGSTGVIGYANSEYDIVNNMWFISHITIVKFY